MTITFAPALQEDIPVIFQLNKALIDQFENCEAIDYDRVISWVRSNLHAQLPHFRRVLADGQTAGFFCLSPAESKMELDSLFVLSPYQNRGLGTQILKNCVEESDGKLFLYVFKGNTRAIQLYRRIGFQITQAVGDTRYIMTYKKQGC